MSEANAYLNEDGEMMSLWRAMVSQGENIPVTMPVRGVSMLPLLKAGRDKVTVVPLCREPVVGDIIVFCADADFYVVHRIRGLTDTHVETIGDNCLEPDKRFAYEAVCGLVTHIQRRNRQICIDTPFWRGYGRLWMAMLPVRAFYRKNIRYPLGRLARKFIKKK